MEKKRCSWAENQPDFYRRYHDTGWGFPIYDDPTLFEYLLLECFQAGLSWRVVLSKRENFRRAFDAFDPEKIAAYDDAKLNALMQDSGIIRNRKKLEAAVINTRVFLKIQQEFGSFSAYLWNFVQNTPVLGDGISMPARTPLSDAVSADLYRRGMRYVGSVTIYSYLQAVGVVNDHSSDCFCRALIKNSRFLP